MAIKATITADEFKAIDAPLQPLYKQSGDVFVLDADIESHPAVAGLKNTVKATREEADKFKREATEFKSRFADLDPDKAREAIKTIESQHDKKLIEEGKVDELVEKRIERMRAEHTNQTKALTKRAETLEQENKTLLGQLSEVLIDSALTQAAVKLGVRQTAVDDVKLRGRMVWKLVDGKPTPHHSDGTLYYGADGRSLLSMEEWIGTLQQNAPHLFEASNGSGSESGSGPRTAGRQIILTRTQARDVEVWRAAQEQAKKTGAEVVVQG
jgi:DNA-directed RNA polymerase subunit F